MKSNGTSPMTKLIEPNTHNPIGDFRKAWIGHSNDPAIREHAASGGIITAVFKHLLDNDKIDAALVCRSKLVNGELLPDIYLAKNIEDLIESQSSKYFDIPMTRGLELIKNFEGRVGIVGLPSQINSISRRISKNPILRERIVFKISLFCGHNSKEKLIRLVLEKQGISFNDVNSFHYRQGLWRGEIVVTLKNGTEQRMPFQDFSHYQNLHILSLTRCLNCFDHFGYHSDLSTGDVWLPHKKQESIKPSAFFARTERAQTLIEEMLADGSLSADETDRQSLYLSQSRSVNYHYNISARAKVGKWLGFNIKERIKTKVTLRDLFGAFIVLINHRISENPRILRLFMRLPRPIVLIYILMFKGLMHYKRKDYGNEDS